MKVRKRDVLLRFSIWLFTMLAMGAAGVVLLVIRSEGLALFIPVAFIGLLGGFWLAMTFNSKHGVATILLRGIIATVLMLGSFFGILSGLFALVKDGVTL